MAPRGSEPTASGIAVRPARPGDRWWLLRAGLSPEHAGTRYHHLEVPLQLGIAPARALGVPRGPSYVIELDGSRVGWIGANPLSGNLEYWLDRSARGGGNGTAAIAAFLTAWAHGPRDRPRAFSIARSNERSLRALRAAFARVGWVEGEQFTVRPTRHGWKVLADPFCADRS